MVKIIGAVIDMYAKPASIRLVFPDADTLDIEHMCRGCRNCLECLWQSIAGLPQALRESGQRQPEPKHPVIAMLAADFISLRRHRKSCAK